MLEDDLKRIICLHPELVEDGLTIEQEEYPIRTDSTTFRCDLKGKDKYDKKVYIELKLYADKHVVYQILKYKTFIKEDARYIVVALDFNPETRQVLYTSNIETKDVSEDNIQRLLKEEENNPKLYERKTQNKISEELRFKINTLSNNLYTEDERLIVNNFMEALKQFIIDNNDLVSNFELEGPDIRRKDEYRLILRSIDFPTDKLVIYNRARKKYEIHIMYVPDFSFKPGNTDKKIQFKNFVERNKQELENTFGLSFYSPGYVKGYDDHLEVTCQGWKGLSIVYMRSLDKWNTPDFIEMVGMKVVEFIEHITPFVKNFYNKENI